MAVQVTRLVFPVNGPEFEPVQLALWRLKQASISDDGESDYAIVVESDENLRHTTLATVLTQAVADRLIQDRQLPLVGGRTLRLELRAEYDPNIHRAAVLAVYGGEDMMRVIDRTAGMTTMIVMPWGTDEIQGWMQAQNALVYGPLKTAGANPDAISDVMIEGLKLLSGSTELQTSLGDGRDRTIAKEFFKIMVNGNEGFTRAQIGTWAAQEGWLADDLDRLEVCAQEALDVGAHPDLEPAYWRPNLVNVINDRLR